MVNTHVNHWASAFIKIQGYPVSTLTTPCLPAVPIDKFLKDDITVSTWRKVIPYTQGPGQDFRMFRAASSAGGGNLLSLI